MGVLMAKKAKKAKAKAALPKKVAGVKVPKEIRNSGSLAQLVTSPLARELVADALIAVAGVLAGNKRTREAVTGAGAKAGAAAMDAGASAKDAAQTATGAVAEVVTEAARRILPSSLTSDEERKGKNEPDETRYPHLATEGVKKPRKKDRDKPASH
jgi:hypothetical protein